MIQFKYRFRKLREEEKLTQEYISQYMNVTQATISNWERGVKEPSLQNLVDLANLFNVTTDYLLGLSDN